MNARLKVLIMMFIIMSATLTTPIITDATTTNSGYNLEEVQKASENISLDSIFALAKEYSIPILIIIVVLSGFSALLGLMFKPMKIVSGSLLGMGILFFILVNFAPQIVGIMMAVIDSVMSRITGG